LVFILVSVSITYEHSSLVDESTRHRRGRSLNGKPDG
jgi:hypothetical protein